MLLDNEPVAEGQEQETVAGCCHHWIIQPAVGPVSEGSCQKCGEVKEFKNSIDYETEWTTRRELARSEAASPPEVMDDVDEIAG